MPRWIVLAVALLVLPVSLPASSHEPMTPERMFQIVQAVDPEAEAAGTAIQLTIAEVPILIIYDPDANRMRAVTPIRSSEALSPEDLYRMMQANFDSALDARYSVAQDRLWAAFIHPLSALEKEQLLSGLGQVANLALTYGSTYNSGALTFGGGDSRELHRALIDKLLKKGEDI